MPSRFKPKPPWVTQRGQYNRDPIDVRVGAKKKVRSPAGKQTGYQVHVERHKPRVAMSARPINRSR